MHRISDFIEKISGVDEAYANLLSTPEVVETLEKHGNLIDLSKLPSFITSIDEYATGIKKCQGCTGLKSCSQPINGHFPQLDPFLGRLCLAYAPCRYLISSQYLKNINTLHMPKSMTLASFDTIYAEANREKLFSLGMDFVINYKKNTFKKGLFLHGSMGTGKTFAMCAIANELAKRGVGCAVVYFPELIASIKAGFNDDNNSNATIENLRDVPVLMIDDIGSEVVTSWMRDEILGRILNHRMMHELPTFFTSNFNFEQLQDHYSHTNRNEYEPVKAARILERIKALASPVEMTGKNYRNRQG